MLQLLEPLSDSLIDHDAVFVRQISSARQRSWGRPCCGNGASFGWNRCGERDPYAKDNKGQRNWETDLGDEPVGFYVGKLIIADHTILDLGGEESRNDHQNTLVVRDG